MKLINASIHNFRGIIDTSITFHPYTLIVGANNAGKSTVIDCIRAFYEKDGFKYKKESDFPLKGAKDDESWIDLTFQLSDEEDESLKDAYKTKNKLKVRKYFQTNTKLQDDKNAAGSIIGYKTDGTLSNEPFYGAKNVQNGKFGDLIYIPAISKVDEHTKLSGPSPLRDLIARIMSGVVESSNAYQALTDSVNKFADNIRTIETEDKRSLSSFENDLNVLLKSWQTAFNLKFTTPSPGEIIKSMLSCEVRDNNHEKSQSIDSFGSGFQRHFIYSLIQLSAAYMPKKNSNREKDFSPIMNLLLFEEPEAFLHPSQQDELARNLMKMGADINDWQVICTTHSSHFVSRNAASIPAIIRVNRVDGIILSYQIDKDTLDGVIEANQSIKNIADKWPKVTKRMKADDQQPEMESVKYFLWLNPDRAGMLFAQNVLLVEGPSETSLISRLLDDGKLTLPPGTYVLDCLGKYNIHRFMNLVSCLGIRHAVLHDDDNNANEHYDLNELIKNSFNTKFTNKIVEIPGDLENFLGVPLAGSPHRKPQHLLYCYGNNKIEDSRLNEFCGLVKKCFERKISDDDC